MTIHCFKCGTPAIQSADGTIHYACNCYQPSLLYAYPPQIIFSNATYPLPFISESAKDMPEPKARPCPLCGELVYPVGFHRCRGIGSVPTPQPEPEVSVERARRIHAMLTDQIIVHRENCTGCQILGRPCVQILPTVDLQEKWQKKAGMP